MSLYGSQKGLNMDRRSGSRGDLSGGAPQHYARSEVMHGGYDPYMEGGYNSYTYTTKSYKGGMGDGMSGGMMGAMGGGMSGATLSAIHQRAMVLQAQCQEYLKKAEYALQSGSAPGDAERYMLMAKETIEQLKNCAIDLRQMGQPNDNVVRTLEMCKDQLKGVHMAITGSMHRRRSTRGSSGSWEEAGRSFNDAMGWIAQHKRLIETAPWGDDPAAIEQQFISHQRFHSSIQRSIEVDRARDEMIKKGDKGSLHALDQEWDILQQMSFDRMEQLQHLQQIIQDMSKEIMWVNSREEEELVFDWGDKNIDQYIPQKQESYSKLMSTLEDKEKDLNKLKARVDNLLKNNHPASDKIEAYRDTLQTQWSWLLQITKCIDVHLKENAAYSQFFKGANETYSALQREHETVRKKFTCDKNTSLEDLLELMKGLEREKEKIMENKRQVQHLVNVSKNIVRLKPRNPEEKSSSGIIVKALCEFKQDQKVICKNNEAILKDNSQRSKWHVTGPGGLDMFVPSVCLIVPPPNPLSVSLANKNEQYYEAILSIWNQLYINVRSLTAWQYCVLDIRRINSLTISMLAKMRPEEYRQIIKNLETHFEEFKVSCHGSQMFVDEDKKTIENQVTGAQSHYDQLVVQLPVYIAQQEQQVEAQQQQQHQQLQLQQQQQHQQQQLQLQQAAAQEEVRRVEEERRKVELKKVVEKKSEVKKEVVNKEQVIKKEAVKVIKTVPVKRKVLLSSSSASSSSYSSSRSLSELHALRMRLEASEATLSQHIHICFGDDGVYDCGLKIIQLETVQHDVDLMRSEYLRLREQVLRELEDTSDSDKAQFLRSEIGVINERLASLEGSSSAYLQRLRALRDMLESVARAEDIVKVHEARLTEKETTSLLPSEVMEYMLTLKSIKAQLDQKKDVLASMEAELAKACHWNSQVGGPFHRCDMMLSKYSEQVGLLSDRWRRIHGQIDTRLQDLQLYHPQLEHYKTTSTSLINWIDATRKKQDALQATKIESIQALKDHINNQKALNSEIKSRRETVENVLRDNEACVNAIKDYETDLASYASGLETLLNIPLKRTMLRSPSMDLNQEATQLQTHYMELLTLSGDFYKHLGELLKNMEELKIRNTRIDLLEEELRLLREDMQDRNTKNQSLEEAVARYQLELSQSQDQLLSMEEVKQTTVLQCSATKESLDSTQSQLADLSDQVTRLNYLLEEEKRKRRLAEERYTQQQEEYDSVLRKRQKELETVSWSKMEVEKSVASKEHEIEQLQRQLAEEAARIKELQKEISKVRSICSTEINNIKLSYESQIHASHTDIQRLAAQREEDTAELQLQYDRMEAERRILEEELRMLRMSISKAEEQRNRAEEESHTQRAVITEEGRRRRELESKVEALMRQRDEESNQYTEELAEVMKSLEEKSEELAYVNHSLEEETRRRTTIEEGQVLFEQTLAQLQVKLTSSSTAVTQLGECEEELQRIRLELERESRERSRVEQNMSRLQGRMKDLQAVRDGLESQVEFLRKANQEEVAKKRQVEAELEKMTIAMTEYNSTIITLRQSQEHASTSGKRGEEERLRLQEELERSLRQNKTSAEHMTQLSAELKALQQQLLQEQAKVKEANHRNEGLYRTIEERSKTLNENSVELQRLQEMTETQTKERLRLEEELRAARHDKEELLRSKQGCHDELSSQIAALELQLHASERSNVDYSNLLSELSSEREKLKLETEKIQKQATETTVTMQSIQSQHSEIVKERDALLRKLQLSEKDLDRLQRLEEELSHIKLSLETERRNKQRVQEENERVKRDLGYWKDQYDSKQSLVRQYDTDKERLEREKNSLKSETDRLTRELREREETYKSRLSATQRELQEVSVVRQTMETELKRVKEPPTLDASTVIFDGVRKPVTETPLTVQGLRGKVSVTDLVDANLLKRSDMEQLREGRLTSKDIEDHLRSYLGGSSCIAGVYDEASDKVIPIYQAMKDGLLRRGTTLELLEAQAASGFIIDPVNNLNLTVGDAYNKMLFGPEFKDKLLSAERAVTGYKVPGTDEIISLFQAIERGLVERGHGIRLLEAQIASGGIIDPEHGHRIDVEVAYKRGYFDEGMNEILTDKSDDTKGFFDPNTEENLTYLDLKERCITDNSTGLILLPIIDTKKRESTLKNTLRKRRVIIVDPETNKEMTVLEAYNKRYIDYDTFFELSEQECEWEEITITEPDGSVRFVINDKMSGKQYDITELLEKRVIDQSDVDKYNSHTITLTQFADIITSKSKHVSSSSSTSRPEQSSTIGSVTQDLPESLRSISSISISLTSPVETVCEQEPVGAIFDTDTLEKISITEAQNRGLVDSITAQRLLEAQACTGGIVNPTNGHRLGIQEASRLGIITDAMATKLKPAQKAYIGFEDVKAKKKLSAAKAMKEMWLPYEAGQRFMEFQFVTGGLYDPEMCCRRTIQDALKMNWLDGRAAQKLQDVKYHTKNLTCPKSKLKITYKDALDNCLMEESTGVRMLQASSVSSRGISSPYNVSSAPGSTSGSRSGSRRGSRRSSVDFGSPSSSVGHYSHSIFTTFSSTSTK
ncbi:desmoplakin-A-like [Pempheris klunzingeri]|uniref:desmoplakin-A-like n=1 Tax=Pempheris klunzingeri TaxID=3127111 RepID=UPI00397FF254